MSALQTKLIALELLRGGRAVLSIPGAWCQGVYARDAEGKACHWDYVDAVAFCGRGVVRAIESRAPDTARAADLALGMLCDAIGGSVMRVNDSASDVTPILAAYDRAIAKLEAEVSP